MARGDTTPETSERHNLFRTQFRKTRYCTFNAVGRCRYGDRCAFAHTASDLSVAPDLTKTSICVRFEQGNCPNSAADCQFAHGPKELRRTPVFEKAMVLNPANKQKKSRAQQVGAKSKTLATDTACFRSDALQDGESSVTSTHSGDSRRGSRDGLSPHDLLPQSVTMSAPPTMEALPVCSPSPPGLLAPSFEHGYGAMRAATLDSLPLLAGSGLAAAPYDAAPATWPFPSQRTFIVVVKSGVRVRAGIEVESAPIGELPCGTLVKARGVAFTHDGRPRLELAGGGYVTYLSDFLRPLDEEIDTDGDENPAGLGNFIADGSGLSGSGVCGDALFAAGALPATWAAPFSPGQVDTSSGTSLLSPTVREREDVVHSPAYLLVDDGGRVGISSRDAFRMAF